MNLRPWVTAALIVSLLFAGFILWPANDQKKADVTIPEVSQPANTNYYMRDAEVTVMNEHGLPAYRLLADEMLHFPDKVMAMKQVRADSLGGVEGAWSLTADEGSMSADGNRVHLKGNVELRGPVGGLPGRMATESLTIYKNEQKLATHSPVVIETGIQKTTATGMNVFYASTKLELLNDVKTTYVP